MRRRPWRPTGMLLAAAAAVLASGCGLTHLQDLNFRVDDRLHFVSPEDRSEARQPVTISWTMEDFTIAAPDSAAPSDDAGYFALFVDRSPIKPGHTMDDVAKGDTFCQRSPSCPDKKYLRDHRVYTTEDTTIRIGQIPSIVGNKSHLQLHTFTVVLMDTSGHRIGESAWELDLRLPRVGV